MNCRESRLAAIRHHHRLHLLGERAVRFVEKEHLLFFTRTLPFHANGMRFIGMDGEGAELAARTYYSVGGGFVVSEELASDGTAQKRVAPDTTILPLPFHTGAELLAQCRANGLSIAQVMRANERHWRNDEAIDTGLVEIWNVMQGCVARGLGIEGTLPGGLKVKRRAAEWHRKLAASPGGADPLAVLDWVNLFALAGNEENAAGGRLVTAPTNGAAGIIPAVLHYYRRFVPGAGDRGVVDFLLTAPRRPDCYLEVKSASLRVGRAALFPDARRERALRHVLELARLLRREQRAVLLFLLLRRVEPVRAGPPDRDADGAGLARRDLRAGRCAVAAHHAPR